MDRLPDAAATNPDLRDQFARTKRKLRLSLTDRCNYRCIYCMPECPDWKAREALLSLEELYALAELATSRLGIEQIRLTGGEPLLRRGAVQLVGMMQQLRGKGLRRLSLTTNGALLAKFAGPLADAGLDGINVSLDSVEPARFAAMTGGGNLRNVLDGIAKARGAGLAVKINAVLVRGSNEGEVLSLTRWALGEDIPLRFIEFMPFDGRGHWSPEKVFTEREIIAALSQFFEVIALPRSADPASYYLIEQRLRLGVISTVSNAFCAQCDRIRITADGHLFSCLFASQGLDLARSLRSGAPREELERLIREAVWNKPRGFIALGPQAAAQVSMHVLGG